MKTILVLEDDKTFGDLVCQSLQQAGYDTILCHDASTAREKIKQTAVDLVIADIIIKKDGRPIPDGGFSLILSIRLMERAWLKYLPIIAISGVTHHPGMGKALVTAKGVGADASLVKPFNPSSLLNLIDELLSELPLDKKTAR